MIDKLFFAASFFFYVWVIRNIFFWISLWQIKEYRFDRLRIHLKETKQGKDIIFSPFNIFKFVVFFLYIFVIFDNKFILPYSALIFLIFFASFLKVIRELIEKRIKLPVPTFKSLFIFILTLLVVTLFYKFPLLDKTFWLIFIDRIVSLVVAIQVLVLSVPSNLYKDFAIYRAVKKINKNKDLLTIGITGSYGKGSIKEFLSTVLSYKFNVLRTFGNYNTPIGIAKTVLSGLSSKKEIFIVEMGAYKIGEIAEMCSVVKPKIGILTAVNDQHISLFGNIENIMNAKYELIKSLPRDGLALFNCNNENSCKLARKTKKKKVMYYTNYQNLDPKENCDITAENIKVDKFHISFDVSFKDKSRNLKNLSVKLVGKHNIENLLPAIYLASYMKMSKEETKLALKKITYLKKTMEPYITKGGTVLIDDTYNANPASVIAASDYMSNFKGKKILVLQPMIELGKNVLEDHYNVALKIGKVCDLLILTNSNFLSAVERGLRDSGGNCTLKVENPKKISEILEKQLTKNDVVVFEGKESAVPLSFIEYEKV